MGRGCLSHCRTSCIAHRVHCLIEDLIRADQVSVVKMTRWVGIFGEIEARLTRWSRLYAWVMQGDHCFIVQRVVEGQDSFHIPDCRLPLVGVRWESLRWLAIEFDLLMGSFQLKLRVFFEVWHWHDLWPDDLKHIAYMIAWALLVRSTHVTVVPSCHEFVVAVGTCPSLVAIERSLK